MPRRNFACPGTLPTPSAGRVRLRQLLRRPVPLGELRPAAAVSGATRRQVIGLAAIAGTVCYVRRRPGA